MSVPQALSVQQKEQRTLMKQQLCPDLERGGPSVVEGMMLIDLVQSQRGWNTGCSGLDREGSHTKAYQQYIDVSDTWGEYSVPVSEELVLHFPSRPPALSFGVKQCASVPLGAEDYHQGSHSDDIGTLGGTPLLCEWAPIKSGKPSLITSFVAPLFRIVIVWVSQPGYVNPAP